MALYLGKQKVAPVISNEKEDLDAELNEQTNLLNDLDNQVDLLGERENKLAQVVDGTITELTASDLAGATIIRNGVFKNCVNLMQFEIPSSLKRIESQAFYRCEGLQQVTCEEGSHLTYIGIESFRYCENLISVIIPASITKIDNSAFSGCTKLESITILAIIPPELPYSSTFESTISQIYIPAGTLSAYESATNWSAYAGKFVELEA